MDRLTQCSKVIQYLKEHPAGMTQRDANRLGIYRLASRVNDLRKESVGILTTMTEVENADGTHSRIAVYTLVEDDG